METTISIILLILLFLIVLGMFRPSKKSRDEQMYKLLSVRSDMNHWFTCMENYMKVIEDYQKNLDKIEKTLKRLNGHFIMTNEEIEKHFPAVNSKRYPKPKLTLVKLKKEIDKFAKMKIKSKEKNNEKPKK